MILDTDTATEWNTMILNIYGTKKSVYICIITSDVREKNKGTLLALC